MNDLTNDQIPKLGATGEKIYDVELDMWVATSSRADEIAYARAVIQADRVQRQAEQPVKPAANTKAVMQQAINALIENRLHARTKTLCETADAAIFALRAAIAQLAEPSVATDAEVGLLVYRGNSVAYIYQKMQSYSNCLSDSWKAMTEIGKGSDGKTDLPSAIRKLQTQPAELTDDKKDAEIAPK